MGSKFHDWQCAESESPEGKTYRAISYIERVTQQLKTMDLELRRPGYDPSNDDTSTPRVPDHLEASPMMAFYVKEDELNADTLSWKPN